MSSKITQKLYFISTTVTMCLTFTLIFNTFSNKNENIHHKFGVSSEVTLTNLIVLPPFLSVFHT